MIKEGELDIDLMPECEVKRILKGIVSDYLENYRDEAKAGRRLGGRLSVEGLVIDEYEEELVRRFLERGKK